MGDSNWIMSCSHPYSVAHNIHHHARRQCVGLVILEPSTTHYVLTLLLLLVAKVSIASNWEHASKEHKPTFKIQESSEKTLKITWRCLLKVYTVGYWMIIMAKKLVRVRRQSSTYKKEHNMLRKMNYLFVKNEQDFQEKTSSFVSWDLQHYIVWVGQQCAPTMLS